MQPGRLGSVYPPSGLVSLPENLTQERQIMFGKTQKQIDTFAAAATLLPIGYVRVIFDRLVFRSHDGWQLGSAASIRLTPLPGIPASPSYASVDELAKAWARSDA